MMIHSVCFYLLFIVHSKMEWNQTIPLHSGSYIISQIGKNFLPLIKVETAVHLVHLGYAWFRSSEVSASDKPAESSCGLASSQQFLGPPVSTNTLEPSQAILSPILSSPVPQQQPTVIESNIYYLWKVNLHEEKQLCCMKGPNFTELFPSSPSVRTTGGRGVGGWAIKFLAIPPGGASITKAKWGSKQRSC